MAHPSTAPVQGSNKKLWSALLVFLVLLLAMGATLIRIQSRPFEPRSVVLPKPAQDPLAQVTPRDKPLAKPAAAAPSDTSAAAGSASATRPASPTNSANKRPSAQPDQTQVATDHAANQAIQITARPRPVAPRTPEAAVARLPAADPSAAPASAAK